jgi:hypothetical protein
MAVDLLREWQSRAAAAGLGPGDLMDVGEAAFAANVPPVREHGPYLPAERAPILAHLEGAARRQRSAWRVTLFEGLLTVAADPAGRLDDLDVAMLASELRDQAREARDRWLVAEAGERLDRGERLDTIAVALGISRATLNRARGRLTKGPSVSRDNPGIGDQLGAEPGSHSVGPGSQDRSVA